MSSSSSDVKDKCRVHLDRLDPARNGRSEVMAAVRALAGLVGREPEVYQPIVLESGRGELVINTALTLLCNNKKLEGATEERDFRLVWQLLHNLCVKRPCFCQRVWSSLHREILDALASDDCQLRTSNVVAALVHQLVLNGVGVGEKAGDGKNAGDGENAGDYLPAAVIGDLLRLISRDVDGETEFPLIAVKNIILHHVHLLSSDLVDGLKQDERWILFDILLEENRDTLSPDLLRFVTSEFKRRSTSLFVTMKSVPGGPVDPREVMQLLEMICGCSHLDRFKTDLQADKSLLIDVVYLLRMVHQAGKEQAMFAPKPSLDDVRDQERMSSDPVYGFKRDLVRLIANLTHQHKGNQDEVREHQGIELLLDCSPADGKNPLITQWVVFAIRNLCEDNLENQDVIRSIERKGTANQDMLKEVGVQIKEL